MSLISGKGNDIDFSTKVDLSQAMIRLKENESVKVRILAVGDYVEYSSHADFNNKIYTQPCLAPLGKACPLCIAGKSGIEQFKNLYAKKRYLFAMADLDSGVIKMFDASKSQAKDLIGQIAEYADSINEIAFNFKRTGNKTETSYKLNPILKMKGDDVDKFHALDEVQVTMENYESVLVPRKEQLLMDVLNDAGFPMKQFFPDYVKSVPTDNTAETEEDDDLPF